MDMNGPVAFDPIVAELVNNELASVTEEMAVIIWKTGRSPLVKTGDFATGICDAKGRVVGQGFAAPFQLAGFNDFAHCIVAKFAGDLAPGDVVISNDPYGGGMSHLPDLAVARPVFHEGRLMAFCIAYSHQPDIGGRFPGGISSRSRSMYEEGIRIPTVKAYRAGVRNVDLFQTLTCNVRVPDDWLADLEAKIAGCAKGEAGMLALLEKYGADGFEATCQYLIDYADRSVRQAILAIPDGTYEVTDIIEDDGYSEDGTLPLKLRVSVVGDVMSCDFAGSAPQTPAALNAPLTMTKAAVHAAIKSIVAPDVPTNAGFFRSVEVDAPAGSVVNPVFPAAVGGRAPLFFRLFDMTCRALAQAMPEKVPVFGEGGDAMYFAGESDGQPFSVLDLFFGGWGARIGKDGIDGVAPVYMGSMGCVSAELIEREYPVVVEGFGYITDSAGPGRFRGSLSIFRRWRYRVGGKVMVRSVRIGSGPGLQGGRRGHASVTTLSRGGGKPVDLSGKTHVDFEVAPGDVVFHGTGGAGGYGDPLTRDPALVLDDVMEEKLSAEEARRQYGVCILAKTGAVDVAATKKLRAAMRSTVKEASL